MKTILIKLQDKFILVSDEVIKEGDTALDLCEDMGTKFESFIVDKATLKYANQECKKIVSKNPDFSLLSEEDCKEIGWRDVEKLADEISNLLYNSERHRDTSIKNLFHVAYIEGFKTAQSLNDKCFSLEDMRNMLEEGLAWWGHHRDTDLTDSEDFFERYIQSLQQTSWDVEIEMEKIYYPANMPKEGEERPSYVPKITNNSIKVLRLL